MRTELNKGDIRWFFDEDSEKAHEVKIKCRETPDGFWNPCYWCTVLETGNESIFEQRFLYKSEEEAVERFSERLKEYIKDEENDLKEIIEEMTASIKKQKALLEKLEKQKENPK